MLSLNVFHLFLFLKFRIILELFLIIFYYNLFNYFFFLLLRLGCAPNADIGNHVKLFHRDHEQCYVEFRAIPHLQPSKFWCHHNPFVGRRFDEVESVDVVYVLPFLVVLPLV